MKTVTCDRCGRVIQDKYIGKYYVGEWTERNTTSARVLDLCLDCLEELDQFMIEGKWPEYLKLR